MRITAKQFALSLYESAVGKKAAEVKVVIKNFVDVLTKHHKTNAADKIIIEFNKIWNERNGIVDAELISARGLSKETVKQLKIYIAKLSGANEVAATEKVDDSILGGAVIKYGDKVLDGSLKLALADLKEKMIKWIMNYESWIMASTP